MRFLLSALLAISIAVLLFEMMFVLIHSDNDVLTKPEIAMAINIQQPQNKPQEQQQTQQQAPQEPVLEQPSLASMAPTIAVTEPTIKAPLMDTDLAIEFSESDLSRYQHNWVQPSGIGSAVTSSQDYTGERDRGTKEMVPIATRQPLIPKVAWENKINGWVLVAFAVNNNGLVEDIRIMDASPRGVFEAHAVSAVEKWRYDAYKGPKKYLSQRIEFLYKNYPNNWGNF